MPKELSDTQMRQVSNESAALPKWDIRRSLRSAQRPYWRNPHLHRYIPCITCEHLNCIELNMETYWTTGGHYLMCATITSFTTLNCIKCIYAELLCNCNRNVVLGNLLHHWNIHWVTLRSSEHNSPRIPSLMGCFWCFRLTFGLIEGASFRYLRLHWFNY